MARAIQSSTDFCAGQDIFVVTEHFCPNMKTLLLHVTGNDLPWDWLTSLLLHVTGNDLPWDWLTLGQRKRNTHTHTAYEHAVWVGSWSNI